MLFTFTTPLSPHDESPKRRYIAEARAYVEDIMRHAIRLRDGVTLYAMIQHTSAATCHHGNITR